MKRTSSLLGAVLVVVLATNMAAAAILFDDAFETDTSGNYNVNQSAGNHAATFAYDYSAVGIPPAPGSTTTLGLKVEANYSGGSGGGVSVSPLGLALTGDFNIKMNVWLNAPGPFPAGGSGSTQVTELRLGNRWYLGAIVHRSR